MKNKALVEEFHKDFEDKLRRARTCRLASKPDEAARRLAQAKASLYLARLYDGKNNPQEGLGC